MNKEQKLKEIEKISKLLLDPANIDKNVETAFNTHDIDKSGFIEKNELYNVLTEMNETFNLPLPSKDKVEKELKRLDQNSDNKLSKEELKRLFQEFYQIIILKMRQEANS